MILDNLDRRFVKLATTRSAFTMALAAFRCRYAILFAALAADLRLTPEQLGERVGFAPVPAGGNAIMNGKAEPSQEDVFRLLELYLDTRGMER